MSRDPIEEMGGANLYASLDNDLQSNVDFLGLAETELHHLIPDWLAKYTTYGSRGQGVRILLTTDFHRLTTGFNLESQLTKVRTQLNSGAITPAQAYNRVLVVHLRNLPAILRNNKKAVGISGGSALVFKGAIRAGLAQAGYFTASEAALGATGIGVVAIGGYYLTDKALELGEYHNYYVEELAELELYNTQIRLASRVANLQADAILDALGKDKGCRTRPDSRCEQTFRAALRKNYFFIESAGIEGFGISKAEARSIVAEQLFIDYLKCIQASGTDLSFSE